MRCYATTIFASSKTRRVVAVWEIAVDERDRHSQREEKTTPKDSPPSVKRICRFSLVASTIPLLHGLRCSDAPVRRALCSSGRKRKSIGSAFAYRMVLPSSRCVCENLLSKNNLKSSGHDRIVDRILCVWFCGPKKARFFGSRKRSIRDGLIVKKNGTRYLVPGSNTYY